MARAQSSMTSVSEHLVPFSYKQALVISRPFKSFQMMPPDVRYTDTY